MTKKFFIDFIVGLYFPKKQEDPAPVQEVKTQEVKTEGYCSQFIPGKVYVKGTFKDIEANSNPELIKVIQRKGDYITVQAISYPDFTPIFKPKRRKIHSHRLPVNYEHIALEGLDFDDNGNPKLDFVYSLCNYNAMFLTAPGYDVAFDETAYSPDYQPMPAVLDDVPEPVEENSKPAPKPEMEAWQKHTCWRCEHEAHSWTHAQFIRGMLLIFDCEESHIYRHKTLTEYLMNTYFLTQLWNLARFFALNVPNIELTSENKTLQKMRQIAGIIANELLKMDHVYICTYNVANPPKLPPEMEAHMSAFRREMYNNCVQLASEQATVSAAPEVLALSYVVVGDYSGINILDNGTHPCCERNSRPEIFVENMRRYFKLHPTKGSIQQLSGYTRFSANLELERRCIKDLLEDFCYYYPIKGKGLRKAEIIKNILDYAELHGLLKPEVQEVMPAPVIAEYDPDFDEDTWTPDYQPMPAVLDDVPEPRITDFREGRKVCSAFSGKDIISCKSRTELISLFSLAENRKTLISSFCSLGFDTAGLDKISSNRELAELLAWNIFISQTPKAKYVPPSVRIKKKSLAGRIVSKSVKAIGRTLASVIGSFFGL